jgi:hypothetical protein
LANAIIWRKPIRSGPSENNSRTKRGREALPSLRHPAREDAMTSRSLLTITAVVAVLYGLAFLLVPDSISALYGVPSAPHTALYTRFFGSALLGFGVIDWFAKDFRSWDATRGVLIGTAVTTAIGGLIALFAVVTGLSNAMTWTSVLVYALIFVGAVYWLSQGEKNSAVAATLAQ